MGRAPLLCLFLIMVALNARADGSLGGAWVEAITDGSSAAIGGLEKGDILLRWSRHDQSGVIDSPFDLARVEIEEAPQGSVTLEGLRRGQTYRWIMGPDTWGITTRPNVQGPLIEAFRAGQERAAAGEPMEAIALWRNTSKDGPPWLAAWLLLQAAQLLGDLKQWEEADAVYQEALDRAAFAGPGVAAQAFAAWGGSFRSRGRLDQAERMFQRSLAEEIRLAPDTFSVARSLNDLAVVCGMRGDFGCAESDLLQARKICEMRAPHSLAVVKNLNNLAVLAWKRGDLATAERYLDQSQHIAENVAPEGVLLANTLFTLGNVADERSDLPGASAYYQRALTIFERLAPRRPDVTSALAKTFIVLGNVADESGDLTKASDLLGRGLAIHEKLDPDSLDCAVDLNNLGNLARERGDLVLAESFLLRAKGIHETLDDKSLDSAWTFFNLGLVASERGDLIAAEAHHRQALTIRERVAPGSLDTADSLESLGEIAMEHGHFPVAESFLNKALVTIAQQAPVARRYGLSLARRGELEKRRGNPAKAESYLRQALANDEKIAPETIDVADVLTSLGELAQVQGESNKAEEWHSKALAIKEKLIPGSISQGETLAALGTIFADRHEWTAAAPLLDRALTIFEDQIPRLGGADEVRSNFRAKHAAFYAEYVGVLQARNDIAGAFEVAERSRARTLLETLADARVEIRRGVDPAILEREHTLRAEVAAKSIRRIRISADPHAGEQLVLLNKEIGDLIAQYRDVQARIRATASTYADLTHPQPLRLWQIQEQILDRDTVLLEYALGEERSYLWLVTSDSISSYELPKQADIEAAARSVYDLVTSRGRAIKGEKATARLARLRKAEANFPAAARALSELALAPVAGLIEGKRLVIAADGILQYIPFAALPAPEGLLGKRYRPLALEHEVTTVPSASLLAVLRREQAGRVRPSKAVAVLADPVFDRLDVRVGGSLRRDGRNVEEMDGGETASSSRLSRSLADVHIGIPGDPLPRLPFTREEARAIQAVVPAGQEMDALDFRASRFTAMSPDLGHYRIVHLATHGVLDSQRPELSGLVFSLVDEAGKPQNGFLDLQDIYNLDLPIDLVVLSACETALGTDVRGEGLVGLVRGFMQAGALRVIASLWSVDDQATAYLMSRFYEAIERDGLTPAAALRRAQLQTLRQRRWASPYYWAAFQIQGDWK
jgi:CHAT domain-containing protein/Tfp pilus assembly protein PilF